MENIEGKNIWELGNLTNIRQILDQLKCICVYIHLQCTKIIKQIFLIEQLIFSLVEAEEVKKLASVLNILGSEKQKAQKV